MMVLRGIVVVIACVFLFAISGGLIAATLNWLAPDYYPGVFPAANRRGLPVLSASTLGLLATPSGQGPLLATSALFPGRINRSGYAADVGVGTGILQGLMLGLLVGATVALGLGWFRQLRWAPCLRGLAVLCGCAAVFAAGGGLIGLALGVFMPGYYRGVVRGGYQQDFNPVDVGIGLGTSQGVILGVIVGALVVIGLAWRRWRTEQPSSSNQTLDLPDSRFEGEWLR